MAKKAPVFITLCLLILSVVSCQSNPSKKNYSSAKALLKEAIQLKKNGYYTDALSKFKKLKREFLYSPLVKEANLGIADIYFQKTEWIKAISSYTHFLKHYPQHQKNDYVYFQLALSFFHQLPKTPDRDLSLATKTLKKFHQHLTLFPQSQYKKDNQKYTQITNHLLAHQQWMIAQFHLSNKRPHSALTYINTLLRNFSNDLPSDIPSRKKLTHIVSEIQQEK